MQAQDYFVHATTFAAPFVSETVTKYVAAESPEAALTQIVEQYKSSLPIYAADAYATADAFHRKQSALARWRSNKARAVEGASSVYSTSPSLSEINGEPVVIADPFAGVFV